MLIELIVFVSGASRNDAGCGRRIDKVDSDTEAWLSGVDLHLSMLAMLLTLRFDFINSLLEENLELRLTRQLLVVLLPSCLEQSSLMLHHFTKFVHDTVVAPQFLLLSLDLARRNIDQRATLLVRSSAAEGAGCCHMSGSTSGGGEICSTGVGFGRRACVVTLSSGLESASSRNLRVSLDSTE